MTKLAGNLVFIDIDFWRETMEFSTQEVLMKSNSGIGTSLTITNKATVSCSITGEAFGTAQSPLFLESCIPSSIEETNYNPKRELYPNPVSDVFYLDKYDNIISVEVYDARGVLVRSTKYAGLVDISDLTNGVYLVYVFCKKGLDVKKIIKL